MPHSPGASARAELVGTVIETFLYGIYLIVFGRCLQVLYTKHKEGRPALIMTFTALAIFCLTTIHVLMDIIRSIHAFTSHPDIPNYAISYYNIVRRDLDLVKSGAYIAMTIVSDALIGYRTYIVWGRNCILAGFLVPLLFADMALGAYSVYLLSLTKPGEDALMGRVTNRVKWFYAVTLVFNVLCTVLISVKIWQVQREVDRYSPAVSALRPRRLRAGSRLMLVVVESAALYSALLILMIVMSVVGSPGMLAMLNLVSPTIGIVFSMVIIRVSTDRTRWDSLKISTHLNFNMSFSGATGTRHDAEESMAKESPTDDGLKELRLSKLNEGDLELGISLAELEDACQPHHKFKRPSLGMNDSGFHSAFGESFVTANEDELHDEKGLSDGGGVLPGIVVSGDDPDMEIIDLGVPVAPHPYVYPNHPYYRRPRSPPLASSRTRVVTPTRVGALSRRADTPLPRAAREGPMRPSLPRESSLSRDLWRIGRDDEADIVDLNASLREASVGMFSASRSSVCLPLGHGGV